MSKKSPKYADHPPNAGHGFAALRVILDNCSSEFIDVLSGVPQGSILGPLLFVLFINDIYKGIDKDTNIGLYADDTKMWRKIFSEHDCVLLQKDINTLYDWSLKNKMHFYLEKCKILQIHNNEPLCTRILPLTKYYYFSILISILCKSRMEF